MLNKTLELITYGLIIACISAPAFSAPAPVKHKHGERFHTHVLPNGNANHQHNKAAKPKAPAAKKTPVAKDKSKPSMSLQQMQSLLRKLMKDPSSVRFGKWWVGVGLPNTGPQWCGFINGKNSYGGYTGERLFISTTDVQHQFSYWIEGPCKPLK